MNLNYEEVPNNILTGKDLDYLSDMFDWNYTAIKKTDNALQMVNDEEIVDVLEKAFDIFDKNLNSVLKILETRGGNNE